MSVAQLRGDSELPGIQRYARRRSRREHGEVLGEVLAGWQLFAAVPSPTTESSGNDAHWRPPSTVTLVLPNVALLQGLWPEGSFPQAWRSLRTNYLVSASSADEAQFE